MGTLSIANIHNLIGFYRSAIEDSEEKPEKTSQLKRVFDMTYWIWITIIVLDLIAQCLRSANMRHDREIFISIYLTITLFHLLIVFLSSCRNCCNIHLTYRDFFTVHH